MKNSAGRDLTWKAKLGTKIAPDLGREIDVYEMQLELRKQGKLDDRLFTAARLRRGVYSPGTLWDAPGMQRIKLPWRGLTADQLDAIAEVAEEYADGVLHVTSRQDVQLHFVHLEDTPDLMRRLAAVDISTRSSCANPVRNVSACPLASVCTTEAFDVTPYAEALARYLLGQDEVSAIGRKLEISFSGCAPQSCRLTRMHDVDLIARVREADQKRGFAVYVGGGPGALFDEFLEEEELLPICQAIGRVFARLGEKKKRGRARLKLLVEKLGIDALKRLVEEERRTLPFDPRWTSYLARIRDRSAGGEPLRATDPLVHIRRATTDSFERWKRANARAQKQAGYIVVTVSLPLGDLSAEQAHKLADVARRYVGDHLRLTADQNLALRWVREADVRAIFDELAAIGLGEAGW